MRAAGTPSWFDKLTMRAAENTALVAAALEAKSA
jgi:hypothetical protein